MRILFVVLTFVFCSQALATSPLTLAQFRDCVGANTGGYDTDCVLDSGTYVICAPSDTSCSSDYQGSINVSRPSITIEGAWPYPTLQRKSSPWMQDALIYTNANGTCPTDSSLGSPCFVTILDLTFDGNYYSGAGQPCCSNDVDLDSCFYCAVGGSDFINAPQQALYLHYNTQTSVGDNTFESFYHSGIYSNSGGYSVGCGGAPYWGTAYCQYISGNVFYYGGASAIALNSSDAYIGGNLMTSNVLICPDSAGAGQVYIGSDSDSIMIAGNTVTSAGHCTNGYAGSGLELHGTDITVGNNVIKNNSNEGIYMEGVQHVSISSSNQSSYVIQSNNQNPQSSSCGASFLDPGIHVHTSGYPGVRATEYVSIDASSIGTYPASGPQTYGVTVDSCDVGSYHGPAVTHLSIVNSCLAGNAYGAYADKSNCGSGGTSACIDSGTSTISGNATSGCGGY